MCCPRCYAGNFWLLYLVHACIRRTKREDQPKLFSFFERARSRVLAWVRIAWAYVLGFGHDNGLGHVAHLGLFGFRPLFLINILWCGFDFFVSSVLCIIAWFVYLVLLVSMFIIDNVFYIIVLTLSLMFMSTLVSFFILLLWLMFTLLFLFMSLFC